MLNTKFEAYKIARELKRSGRKFTFYRNSINEFGEPLGDIVELGSIVGLYHEQSSNIQITTGDTTQTRTKKIPMILCLAKDVGDISLDAGDYIYINGKMFKLTGIVDIFELNIVLDISLELVDDDDGDE